MNLPDDIIRQIDEIIGTTSRPYRVVGDAGEWIDTGCLAWPLARDAAPQDGPVSMRNVYMPGGEPVQDFLLHSVDTLLQNPPAELSEQFEQLGPLTAEQKAKLVQYIWESIMSGSEPDEGHEARHPDTVDALLARVRSLLQDYPVIAYKGDLTWADLTETYSERLVVASTTDQFDILRIERTDAANYGMMTEELIGELKILDAKYGIEITGAAFSAVEFVLKRIPKGKEARELGKRLLEFCPDIMEAPAGFPGGKVALWWD